MRYFRSLDAMTYESVRQDLDAAYGYPNSATKTATAIPLASAAPTDALGRVYLMASAEECEYPVIAERLPEMLAAGMAEEISPAEFAAQFPPPF